MIDRIRTKFALGTIFVAYACAQAETGDPPLPIDGEAGFGGGELGGSSGSGFGGSVGTGGSSMGGASGTGTSGSSATGGSAGTTGGSAGTTGGSAGTTGGSAGTTGGSVGTGGSTAGKGGSAGSATGGTAGSSSGGSAGSGKGGTGGTGGSATGGSAGKGGSAGNATGGTAGSSTGGTAGAGNVLFQDNFETGTDGWSASPGGVWATTTDGSTVYGVTGATGSSTWRVASAGEPSWTNVQIEARVKVTSFAGSSSSYYAGLCARYQSESTYVCFALRSNGQVTFRVSGSNTGAWNPPAGAIQTGTWYNVRIVATGANVTGYLNNVEVPVGTRVTNAPTMGGVAIVAPGTNAVFDDIRVTTP